MELCSHKSHTALKELETVIELKINQFEINLGTYILFELTLSQKSFFVCKKHSVSA